jgi:nucleoside-diphosphate-sugar epimerase
VRVLLTGSAGFIGTAVGRELEQAGHEVVRVDVMLDRAHHDRTPPPGRTLSTYATPPGPRRGTSSCEGSTRSATRRRWSGRA